MKLAEEYPFEGLEGFKQPELSKQLTEVLEKALISLNNLTSILEKRLKFHSNMCDIYNMLSREESEVDFKNLGLLYEAATGEVEKLMNEMSEGIKKLEEDLPFLKRLINTIELTVSRVNLYKKIVEYNEEKGKSKLSTLAKLLKNSKLDEIDELVEYVYDRIRNADKL
ncbi:MAG: hypothetical protein QW327_01960 [Candidatus Odinarchaeota archaeon]